ncbi:sensor histidine kinase [Sporosarcina sp. 179-K 3D1 HS]|uniref:ATP-binding protein n=1 Tax=Sporosarcina sp. 179-K 3D1 HS TaxID=3232169 RepID=UPI0039A0AAA4
MLTKQRKQKLYRSEVVVVALIAIITAIAGEIKVIPFSGETFRFGFGSIAFFLMILIYSPTSLLRTGFVTGLTVVGFRLVEDLVLGADILSDSMRNHGPAFLFYFLFAVGLHLIQVEKYKTFPLLLGAWAVLFEFVGNGAEHITRWFLQNNPLETRDLALLLGVAVLRSFFTVGLYSSITISEQKRQMQEMLGIGSELYAETLYLQKSMNHIEQITASSHDLYRQLKKENLGKLSRQALSIAQEIHEVKKDSQRILSGLSKLTKQEKTDAFYLSELLEIVVSANTKYSELLQKNCRIQTGMDTNFETDQHIPLLALLNNLTTNAIESIDREGDITIEISEEVEDTIFTISDSGKGIPLEDNNLIFEPGYTTKFNEQGVASTGIGLSHVMAIVESLEGHIQMGSMEIGTRFQVRIPTKNIRK